MGRAHNPEVAGSNPAPAIEKSPAEQGFSGFEVLEIVLAIGVALVGNFRFAGLLSVRHPRNDGVSVILPALTVTERFASRSERFTCWTRVWSGG